MRKRVLGETYRPPGTVPASTHQRIVADYLRLHPSSSPEHAAAIVFGYREAQCAIAGHSEKVAGCRVRHPALPGWRAEA